MSDLNTSRYNWGEQLKVEVGDLTNINTSTGARKPSSPIPEGRYAAFLQEVKIGTFKSGSYGVTLTYVIESGDAKNRKINEYLVLSKADGTPVVGSGGRLKQKLMAYGLPIEKINAFKGPRNEHDLGDFKFVLGAPVTIVVTDDKDKTTGKARVNNLTGQPYRRVAFVDGRVIEE
jgi:hypothetical protein